MKVTVLIDNRPAPELVEGPELLCEWGLAFHIEHNGRQYLLDCGASGAFAANAAALGIDLAGIDCAVLSHAHHDHGGGMGTFFQINSKARFFVAQSAAENCWAGGKSHTGTEGERYIGLPPGVLQNYKERMTRVTGVTGVGPGAFVIPHSTKGLEAMGREQELFIRQGETMLPDELSHEQSLVFDTDEGLVIFNSCSHSGPEVILKEARAALPGRPVRAYIGGLHLYKSSPEEIARVAGGLDGIARIYTGHCTGDEALALLRQQLGPAVVQLHTGMRIIF